MNGDIYGYVPKLQMLSRTVFYQFNKGNDIGFVLQWCGSNCKIRPIQLMAEEIHCWPMVRNIFLSAHKSDIFYGWYSFCMFCGMLSAFVWWYDTFFSCDQALLMVLSVCPSAHPSVCHTLFTMSLWSYHHEIFGSNYHWQKWCPCKRKVNVRG